MLLACLLATALLSVQVKLGSEKEAQRRFALVCDEVALKIHERLGAYALILQGGAGLFSAAPSVGRREWKAFVETLRAQGRIPGVQGIGFSEVIRPDQLALHTARIRGEGFPEYSVRPPGERSLYSSIIYLEPFRDRNLRAFGYDMYSEPVRREAMDRAGNSGEASLSGKVVLVQETATEVQAGTLMYVAVYRNGAPIDTLEQRRAALFGWVYSPYRMKDLMSGILGLWSGEQGVQLQIYDGSQPLPDQLLFESRPNQTVLHSIFYQQRWLDFGGRTWLLAFEPTSSPVSYTDAWATLGGGVAISILLCGLLFSVLNTRARADRIAERLTCEIRTHSEQLEASEYRWRFALEGAGDGLWDWNVAEKTVFFSKIWKQMLGYAEDEVGSSFDDWRTRVHPDDLEQVMSSLRAHLDGTSPLYTCECRLRCKDGTWKWILDRGLVVLRDVAGKPLRVIGTHCDITARKLVEEALQKKNEEMERFTYAVSHDLKSPLVTIKTFLGYLKMDMEAQKLEKVAKDLGYISNAADKMELLLGELLELARVGKRMNSSVDVPMQEVVQEALALVAGQIAAKGAEIVATQEPVWLYGDRVRLVAIFQNLIDNAIKFLGNQPAPRVEIGIERAGGEVEIFVRDNGQGIDPKGQTKVFGLFEKLDMSTPGSGLGLALVRRIVELHGGKIRVESEGSGLGTTFRFTLAKTQIRPQ